MRTVLPGRIWVRVAAAAAVGAVALAACGSSGSSPTSSNTGTPIQGGTATFALPPNTTPNYIFPMTPATNFSVVSISNLQYYLFRPLYWFGGVGNNGTAPGINYKLSLANAPVYSNGNKTVTMTLKGWKFSNGEVANARSVVFWMNMLKAAVKNNPINWGAYVPGLFPDNVTSYKATGPETVVMQLNKAYSPTWFTYNELSQIIPLPAAWDIEKTGQKPGNFDTTPAGALAVYKYLTGQAKSLGGYATNPLWKIVDGPWHLQSFDSTGRAVFTFNSKYSGPVPKDHISKFIQAPFTSDTAEFNVLSAGLSAANHVDFGYLPSQDISQKARLSGAGYTYSAWYDFGFDYAPINFNSNTLGYVFRQLYVRQALAEVYDQPGDLKAFYANVGTPTVGPVPLLPKNSFTTSLEYHTPYTFNVNNAKSLLTSHGWKMVGGVMTCEGSCGAHIAKGTKLVINMPYASGALPLTQSLDNLKSDALKAGIVFNLTPEPFNTVIGTTTPCKMGTSACKWEIDNWGGGWVYAPDYLPTGEELFQTGATANYGSYSDPTADKLIAKTTTDGAISALDAYENYLVKQLPVLYQPNPAYELCEINSKLHGVQLEAYLSVTPEEWYFVK